jgi:SNF2 family DNA or RNA helicase
MKKEDYLDMEEPIINDIEIEMPPDVKKKYEEFEREAVLEIFSGLSEISAVNAAALRSKLLQFSNGAIYDANKMVHHIHDLKLEALESIVEEANGKPVLVAYSFEHDRERILKKFKGAVHLKTEQHIKDWNAGKIPMLVMHPASGGHGLNLQTGSNIIAWFGLNDSLELYQQFNARLHRQGQDQVVIINRILCKGTEDYSVVSNLDHKEKGQDGLMAAVKALVAKYLKKFF